MFIHIFMALSIFITSLFDKESFALCWLGLAGGFYVWNTLNELVFKNKMTEIEIKRLKQDRKDIERFSKFLETQVKIMKGE